MPALIVFHLTIILAAGFIAGLICKRLNISILIGYMVIGTLIGPGCLDVTGIKSQNNNFVSVNKEPAANKSDLSEVAGKDPAVDSGQVQNSDEIALEGIAEFGVLLLLFAIGVEFSLDKMAAMAKYMFVGGVLQMILTGLPTALLCHFLGLTWSASILIGCVVSLSSTALVYKSMGDVGMAVTRRGKATLGILLFQDVALVPMLLLIPILSGGAIPTPEYWGLLALKTLLFCLIVVVGKISMNKLFVPMLAKMRARELLILFVLMLLMGLCHLAIYFGLTPSVGALAAGLLLGDTRLTAQIDALFTPFREAFSAMFFISLGMLMDFGFVWQKPILCLTGLAIVILLKTIAAATAMYCCGFQKWSALGFGVCIAQVGELAFMLLTSAYAAGAIPYDAYNTVLFVSVASLVLTPHLVNTGLRMASKEKEIPSSVESKKSPIQKALDDRTLEHVIVIGAGHIGTNLAARLETMGKNVSVIDFSPINLYKFAQEGLVAVAGDASKPDILYRAGIETASAIFVTIPDDMTALNIVRTCRDLNPNSSILCRVRYQLNIKPLQRAGLKWLFAKK